LEKVGGYFTKKKGSGDLDLSWKVKKEGYNICFNEKAIAYHRDPDTLKKVWRREKRIGHQEYKLTKQHPKEIVKIRRLLRFYPLLLPFIVLLVFLSWPLVAILVVISSVATLVAVNGSLKVRSMAWLVFNVMNLAYCTGFLSSLLTREK
jgi:cellulose synthase/poly-beta-1,6-N-acetylglucosamine synthase-like glycosyltransferase